MCYNSIIPFMNKSMIKLLLVIAGAVLVATLLGVWLYKASPASSPGHSTPSDIAPATSTTQKPLSSTLVVPAGPQQRQERPHDHQIEHSGNASSSRSMIT